MHFSFSVISPSKLTPCKFPSRVLRRELPAYKAFFFKKNIKFPIKIPIDKEMYPFSQRP
jgi:hypothetical protein